jgi:uncharacterized protein YjbI with pentapeptide repeats/uncharacterized protein YdcH (DUF465 family)
MSDSQQDLASLISRISQLEERQNVSAKYMVGLKRQFDSLTQEFNTRPELQQIESFKSEISALQQHLQQLPTLSNGLDTEIKDAPAEPEKLDDAEVVRRFTEPVEQQLRQEALERMVTASSDQLAEVEVETDTAEAEEAVEQITRVFSDQEFKTERAMWLVNRIYAAEEDSQEIPVTAEEFLQWFKEGKRNFTGINLSGVDLSGSTLKYRSLSGANLQGLDLTAANLSQANLSKTSLKGAKLMRAQLTGADLSETDLSGADLQGANLSQANLRGANLNQANLSCATLSQTNLSKASLRSTNLSVVDLTEGDLSGADLTFADLRGADLALADIRAADLSNANLAGAGLSDAKVGGANLRNTELTGAIMPDGTTHE